MTTPTLRAIGLLLTFTACSGNTAPDIEPAAEVSIVCGESETRVETAVARAHGSGVAFRVTNETGSERMLAFRQEGSVFVGPGVSEVTRAVIPGWAAVACLGPVEHESPEDLDEGDGLVWPYPGDDEWVEFEVVDPAGMWSDDRLDCESPTGTHSDFQWDLEGGPVPPGERGDPVAMARRDLPAHIGDMGEVQFGDSVGHAGYRDIPGRVRLVRRGQVVAVISYRSDGRGGWHVGGVEYCEEQGPVGGEPSDG